MCRCGWRAPVRQWGCRGWCDSGDRSPQGWGAHVGRFHLGGRHWITVSSIPDSAAGLGVLCMTYTRRTLARRTCMMYLVSVSTVYCTPLRGGLDENLPLTPYTYRCALSPKLSWTYLLFHCLAWPSCGGGVRGCYYVESLYFWLGQVAEGEGRRARTSTGSVSTLNIRVLTPPPQPLLRPFISAADYGADACNCLLPWTGHLR